MFPNVSSCEINGNLLEYKVDDETKIFDLNNLETIEF